MISSVTDLAESSTNSWGESSGLDAQSMIFESVRAMEDVALNTEPELAFWQAAWAVYAERGLHGELLERYRTEVRSRWTEAHLYLLFVCPYETLHLKPDPETRAETNRLWEWDVAEVFLGADFENIRRYKEFEVSPQGEWVDVDVDLDSANHEDGWVWRSGFEVAARIDAAAKVWYGAMKIPFAAFAGQRPVEGMEFRANLLRSQGSGDGQVLIAWQPPMRSTFHVPERFGVLRLGTGRLDNCDLRSPIGFGGALDVGPED